MGDDQGEPEDPEVGVGPEVGEEETVPLVSDAEVKPTNGAPVADPDTSNDELLARKLQEVPHSR